MTKHVFIAVFALCLGFVGCSETPDHSSTKSSNGSNSTTSSYSGSNYSSSSSTSSSNSGTAWTKTAGETNGYDWLKMNTSQKRDIVSGVIRTWKSNDLKITADSSYFISALDSFYGDAATNSENLASSMSMIATMGGVLSK